MILNVLAGDALAAEFRKTGIAGEIVVCRDALIAGPIDAPDIDEFWAQRARFVLGEYGEDEISYQEKVADELERLSELSPADEVNLWFEYELFCSVNLWFCLSLIPEDGCSVFRVSPSSLNRTDRWDGFGKMDAEDLIECHANRQELAVDDIALGRSLWDAYRAGDHDRLIMFAAGDPAAFPYLEEVCAAAAVQDMHPREILRSIKETGENDFGKIFAEFKKRAGVYGYGDLQVESLLQSL